MAEPTSPNGDLPLPASTVIRPAYDRVLLKLGGGQGWRFRCAGGQVSVDESIYLGERGHMRRSQQIVVTGEAGADGASVRWALKKV